MFNKKAMLDDLFDLLFTVMVMFFALFFIHANLSGSFDNANRLSDQSFEKHVSTHGLLLEQRDNFNQHSTVDLELTKLKIKQQKRVVEIKTDLKTIGEMDKRSPRGN